MKEIWKDIRNYEGLYQVSNLGRVRSLDRTITYMNGRKRFVKGTILTPAYDTRKYLFVGLSNNGIKHYFRINRLVAEAFIPNQLNLSQVNHKDENKDNNSVENLEWCDSKYNCNYGTRNKRVSKSKKGIYNTKISKSVLQINPNTYEIIKEFPSLREIERELGYSPGNISSCCNGNYKIAYGFKWAYK